MDVLNFFNTSDTVLLSRISNAVYYKNKAGALCFSNSAFSELLRLHQEGRVDNFWDALDQDAQVIKTQQAIAYQKTIQDKVLLKPIYFMVQKEPAYDEARHLSGVITSVTWCLQENRQQDLFLEKGDIVQFFRHYIQELKNYYESIIASMPGNVYWLSRECVLLGGNENLARMFKLNSYKDLAGLTYEKMAQLANWTEGQGESFRADELIVMQSGVPRINVEEPPVVIDGETKYYISNKVPLRNIVGEVVGVLGISLDITEKKHIEQALVAKEAAESANRAKTEFLANMSHDMKTPLAGIVTTAEVIVGDKSASERDKQYAAIIAASGKQLASFFTSCLELSKMEMQEWVSKTEIFSLKQLVSDVTALFAPQALSKKLSLNVDYDDTLPSSVEGHRESLYRVLLNLIGNALKFTEKGSITLRALRGDSTHHQPVNVIFQVQDTGIGIPEDKHQEIFEKLKRLKPSYESQIEGSGIGLYIVDQYVKRMGGEIKVESKIGQGSMFTVTLPLKTAPGEAIESIATSRETISKNIGDNQAADHLPRVLLVEDNEMIQFITKSLLNSAGFSVDIASTGEEAVALFEPYKYGLIYMDIGLPTMTGYETAVVIRQKEKQLNATSETAIIALTGHGAMDVQAFCGKAGMQGVLSKPLSREQAEALWKHFNEDATISVPGLTLLTQNEPEPSAQEILDIDATIKMIGAKDIALDLITTLIEDLKNQFLPQVKTLILQNNTDYLKFLLHRQLGALAYAKAPRLEKTLSEVHAMAQKGVNIDQAVYQEIEKETLRVIECYEKMNLMP